MHEAGRTCEMKHIKLKQNSFISAAFAYEMQLKQSTEASETTLSGSLAYLMTSRKMCKS